MDEGRWIMQGRIGQLRRNCNIASVKGKGLGAFISVICDVTICDCDITLGETLRYEITICDINICRWMCGG